MYDRWMSPRRLVDYSLADLSPACVPFYHLSPEIHIRRPQQDYHHPITTIDRLAKSQSRRHTASTAFLRLFPPTAAHTGVPPAFARLSLARLLVWLAGGQIQAQHERRPADLLL